MGKGMDKLYIIYFEWLFVDVYGVSVGVNVGLCV